jgi:TPR repeat protein
MNPIQDGLNAFHNGDYRSAIAILLPIAEAGDPEAQCVIGNLYQLGLGVAIDIEEAAKWYRKSSEQGYGVASNNLAGIILSGYYGGDRALNQVQAEALFQKAIAQNFQHTPSDLPGFLEG